MAQRQYKREPLDDAQVDQLFNACQTFREKLIVFTLLDTGMRVSELADLTKSDIQWQEKRLKIRGKGGPFGKKTKIRVLPMTDRVRPLIEHHYAMEDTFGIGLRTLQALLGHDNIQTTEIYMNLSPEDVIREFQEKW